MKFTVELSEWNAVNNPHNEESYRMDVALLNSNGMCCLGFACKSLGLSNLTITDVLMPDEIQEGDQTFDSGLVLLDEDGDVINSPLSCKAQEINDNEGINLQEKMKKLHELFTEGGHAITFELKGEQVYPEVSK